MCVCFLLLRDGRGGVNVDCTLEVVGGRETNENALRSPCPPFRHARHKNATTETPTGHTDWSPLSTFATSRYRTAETYRSDLDKANGSVPMMYYVGPKGYVCLRLYWFETYLH